MCGESMQTRKPRAPCRLHNFFWLVTVSHFRVGSCLRGFLCQGLIWSSFERQMRCARVEKLPLAPVADFESTHKIRDFFPGHQQRIPCVINEREKTPQSCLKKSCLAYPLNFRWYAHLGTNFISYLRIPSLHKNKTFPYWFVQGARNKLPLWYFHSILSWLSSREHLLDK